MKAIKETKCKCCNVIMEQRGSYVKTWCSQYCRVMDQDHAMRDIMVNQDDDFYYLIGFILTDGYVASKSYGDKSYSCVISQSIKDEQLMLDIQQRFGGKIHYLKSQVGGYKPGSRSLQWRVTNREFIDYLTDTVGFRKGKTYNVDVTDWFSTLTQQYKAAFLRGCYDGDGSINCYDNGSTHSCTTSICSASKTFIDMVADYFSRMGTMQTRDKEDNDDATCNLYYWYMNSRDALQLSKIYDNCKGHLYMERKYNNYLRIVDYYKSHKPRKKTSQYNGVRENKRCIDRPYTTSMIHKGKRYHGEYYANEINAAIAYDMLKYKHGSTKMRYNFPELVTEYAAHEHITDISLYASE